MRALHKAWTCGSISWASKVFYAVIFAKYAEKSLPAPGSYDPYCLICRAGETFRRVFERRTEICAFRLKPSAA